MQESPWMIWSILMTMVCLIWSFSYTLAFITMPLSGSTLLFISPIGNHYKTADFEDLWKNKRSFYFYNILVCGRPLHSKWSHVFLNMPYVPKSQEINYYFPLPQFSNDLPLFIPIDVTFSIWYSYAIPFSGTDHSNA